jgi:hypothetical protein
MRIRTKVAAFVGGAGLAASTFVVGVGSPVQAAPAEFVVIECDNVAGYARLRQQPQNLGGNLAGTANETRVQAKSPNAKRQEPGYTSDCTTDASQTWLQNVAANGTLVVQADLRNGNISCNTGVSTYAASGQMRIRFNQQTSALKPYDLRGYVRLGYSDGANNPNDLPDATYLNGIVIRGIGVGADLSADLLQQPVTRNRADRNVISPFQEFVDLGVLPESLGAVGSDTTIIETNNGGRLRPGTESAVRGAMCQANAEELEWTAFSTDGVSAAIFAEAGVASALGDIQTECITGGEPLCQQAINDFATAYAIAAPDHTLNGSVKVSFSYDDAETLQPQVPSAGDFWSQEL